MSGAATPGSGELPFAPASERNRTPIWRALEPRLPERGRLLEIGAGTGQHAVYMAARAPALEWLPTDRPEALPGLARRIALEGSGNIRSPLALDVRRGPWPAGPFHAAYAANVAHIMDWPAVEAMFEGLARCLAPGAGWFLYGPFRRGGGHTSAGNRAFDRSLRAAGTGMGLRDVEALETLGARLQLLLREDLPMPANNRLLVFHRAPRRGDQGQQESRP